MNATAWLRAVPGWLTTAAGAFLLGYVLLCMAAWLAQRRLLYFPDTQVVAPAAVDVPAQVLSRVAADGVSLTMWWAPPREGRPVVIYFHGNGGNLAYRAPVFRDMIGAGYGLLALSYRGYAGSGGKPGEEGFAEDARAAHSAVAELAPGAGIVLFGESLGSGVAVRLATERPVSGVVLNAPYTSVEERAQEIFWYLPVRLLLADRYRSRDIIGGIRAPLLILHGEADTVIPVAHGRALFHSASEPKTFVPIAGAGHDELWGRGGREAVLAFLARLVR
jgi:hypothetical protein